MHGKFGKPCPVCGEPVQRIVYAHNEANYCARCQTGGRLLSDRALSRLLRQDWPRTLDEMENRTARVSRFAGRFAPSGHGEYRLFQRWIRFNGVGALGSVQLAVLGCSSAPTAALSLRDRRRHRSRGAAQFLLARAMDLARPAAGTAAGLLAACSVSCRQCLHLAGRSLMLTRCSPARSASIPSPPTSPRSSRAACSTSARASGWCSGAPRRPRCIVLRCSR